MARTKLVYRFSYVDRTSGQRRVSDDYATVAAIGHIGAEVDWESELEVDESRVGVTSGFFIPSKD